MERPLRPEEASSEQGVYLTGPQGKFGCHHVTTVIKSTVPRYGPDSLAPQKKKKSGDAVKSMYL